MMMRLKSFLHSPNSLASATAILVSTTFLSNILGMLRDRFFAQKIPTGLLDTYFAAFRIPDFIFNILILGAVSAAFIPVFLEYRQKSEREAWRVAESTITLALLILVALAILLWFLMPMLIPIIVPHFDAAKQLTTVTLSRLLLIQPVFFGLSYLFAGVLNAMKRFVVYALAPLLYNLAIILSTVLFADRFGVQALVWGVLAGAFLHMLVQLLAAQRIGLRLHPALNLNHPAIRKIFSLMIPRSIGLGAFQLTLLAFTAIASGLGAGSVAIYNLADNIQTMPTAVFGLAFISALYPTLSEAIAQRRQADFARMVWQGIRYLLVILVPLGLGLILLRAQTVRLILGTGYFDWRATVETADTLGFFALVLFAQPVAALLSRAFYALHDTRTPTIWSVASYAVAIGLGRALAPASGANLGVPGLALALSVGSLLTVVILYATLRQRVAALRRYEAEWPALLGHLVLGSLALVIGVQLSKLGVASLVDMDRFWGVLLQASVATAVGGGLYYSVLAALGVPELALVTQLLRARFLPSQAPAVPPVNGRGS